MQHSTFLMSYSYQIDATDGDRGPVIDRLARYGPDVPAVPRQLAAVMMQHFPRMRPKILDNHEA